MSFTMPRVRELFTIRTLFLFFFLIFLLLFLFQTFFHYKLDKVLTVCCSTGPFHTPFFFFLFFFSLLAWFVCVFFLVYDSMIPTHPYSVSSHPMPIDLNEDHNHHLFSSNHQASSSSSSLSYSILFNNPDQDQGGSCYWEPKQLKIDDGEAMKMVTCGGSWDHSDTEKDENKSDLKLRFRKREEGCENLQGEDSSLEWMPSKIRMMVSDQRGSNIADISNSKQIKCEEKNPPLSSSLGTDNSNYYSSNHSNITVRVCADCHTTKTPLWRSGPKGPKSLCNACGIRQRKARRAMAVAATVNGTNMVSQVKKENNLHSKGMKKSKKVEGASQLKRKYKTGAKYRKRFSTFEDLMMSLSENLALQQVFPQDEKEAAILLMALSYGLLHGFPSHRYFDL